MNNMPVDPDSMGIEFMEYKYITRIANINFKRAHAFEWLFLHFKEQFVLRYLPDWHDFTPVPIKLRASNSDQWVPLTLRSITRRLDEQARLLRSCRYDLVGMFTEGSIYMHHIIVHIVLDLLEETFANETNRRWGGNLGNAWETRFTTYPVNMVTAHSQIGDFHPEDALVVNAQGEFSDPVPLVFTGEYHAGLGNTLNELLEKVRDTVVSRILDGNTYTWKELCHPCVVATKRTEGERYQIMIDHCGGGPLTAYTNMRNGPVDFAFLRHYNNEPQSVAVQAKSFNGKSWDQLIIDVGDVVQDVEAKMDVLVLLNEYATTMDIYFIKWDFFKQEMDRTAARSEGQMMATELVDEQNIHTTAQLNAQTVVSVMTFEKLDDICEDTRADEKLGNNAIFCAHMDKFFRPLTFQEKLILEAGKYI